MVVTRGQFTVAVFLDGGGDCAKNNTKDFILGGRGKWRQSMFLSEYIKKSSLTRCLINFVAVDVQQHREQALNDLESQVQKDFRDFLISVSPFSGPCSSTRHWVPTCARPKILLNFLSFHHNLPVQCAICIMNIAG